MENVNIQLYKKMTRLQWLLHRSQLHGRMQNGPLADPTRGQGRVLALLKMQPEISTKDMSYLLGIRQQSLNELLNKLEKGGYVTRTPSEADRRVMMVRLTEKGRAEQQEDDDYSALFSCLSEDEQAAFADYLDRVIAALESKLGLEADDEVFGDWMAAARSRMGDEMFDRLMSMRGGHGGHGRARQGAAFFGFGAYGGGPRGPAQEGSPGENRFSGEHGGYECGRGPDPFGRRPGEDPCAYHAGEDTSPQPPDEGEE